MNKIIKDACILFAITLVAGIVLGAVYNITKGPIAEHVPAKRAPGWWKGERALCEVTPWSSRLNRRNRSPAQ